MSKIVRVQGGDYKLIVGASGQPGYITLDTNPAGATPGVTQGKVTITGDLEVLGNTTTVQSETLEVKDNIIYLNVGGGSSTGISGTLGGIAGLDIDRGSLPDVSVYWDENIVSEDPTGLILPGGGGSTNGAFVFKDAGPTGNLRALATNSLVTYYADSDLGGLVIDVGSGDNGVLRVVGDGGSPYQDRIINYTLLSTLYAISTVARNGSNVATVTTTTPHGLTTSSKVTVFCGTKASFNATVVSVLSTPTSTTFTYENTGPIVVAGPLGSETGTVRPYAITGDNNIPNMRAVVDYADRALLGVSFNRILENDTKVQTYDYETSGVSKITFEVDGNQRAIINSNGLTVDNVRIRNNNISNTAVDNIYIDNVLGLANKAGTPPAAVSGYVKLYSKNSPGTGGTGLYFVNTEGTNDELISKTKALLYSLIL